MSAEPIASSSSVLWAKPSKEWVIPPKPKPGRKPKKDAPEQQDHVISEDGRKGQNRAAQRAFRQRKEEQLAELQARVKRFEEGEVERHVALQAVSRKLKDENQSLRAENERLAKLLEEKTVETEKLRALGNKRPHPLASSRAPSPAHPSPKRIRLSEPDTASSTSWRSSPPLTDALTDPSREAYTSSVYTPDASPFMMQTLQSHAIPSHTGSLALPPPMVSACGLCADGISCLCAEMVQAADNSAQAGLGSPCLLCVGGQTQCLCVDIAQHPNTYGPVPMVATSPDLPPRNSVHSGEAPILVNLPAFQPAVPLRRRPNAGKTNLVFPITPLASVAHRRPLDVSCTGDPSDCLACADDVFGKAFCAAVGQSIAATSSEICANCPNAGAAVGDNCCRGPDKCEGCPERAPAARRHQGIAAPSPQPAHTMGPESIPCNQAWQQIKSHPNVSFADLHLLAEVVARRSKCTGPRVVISPALGTAHDERNSISVPRGNAGTSISELPSERPDIQIACGRPPVRELPTEAVKDAMRLLEIIHPIQSAQQGQ